MTPLIETILIITGVCLLSYLIVEKTKFGKNMQNDLMRVLLGVHQSKGTYQGITETTELLSIK